MSGAFPGQQLHQVLLELQGRAEPVLSDDPRWSEAWALAREMRLELEGLKERQRLLKQASDESLARHLDDANRFPAAQRP